MGKASWCGGTSCLFSNTIILIFFPKNRVRDRASAARLTASLALLPWSAAGVLEERRKLLLQRIFWISSSRYNTLSGMIMWLVGDIPRTGDVVKWEQWQLELVDLDGNRIDKVLATFLPESVSESDHSRQILPLEKTALSSVGLNVSPGTATG